MSGGFAYVWFGWGGAGLNPSALSQLLQIGRGLAVLTAVLGIVLAVRSPAASTPMTDRSVARRYGGVVVAEFGLLSVGNIVLSSNGLGEWIPVSVCAVVGIHFIPLSRVFAQTHLMILGVLVTAVAVGALVVGLASTIAPGTITGSGAGLCLLTSAVVTLLNKVFYTADVGSARTAGSRPEASVVAGQP